MDDGVPVCANGPPHPASSAAMVMLEMYKLKFFIDLCSFEAAVTYSAQVSKNSRKMDIFKLLL
jgi:hypothetical protein